MILTSKERQILLKEHLISVQYTHLYKTINKTNLPKGNYINNKTTTIIIYSEMNIRMMLSLIYKSKITNKNTIIYHIEIN